MWLGEVDKPTDRAFEQFKEMAYGIRAGFIILRRYIRRYGADTIEDIVSRWAPSNENNTQAYIDAVSRRTGIPRSEHIRYEDKPKMLAIVDAMIRVECGQGVPMATIEKGYSMA